jgi:hypothetical protein
VKLSNQTHRSSSDPEARLYRKGDLSSTRLSYLVHDLIDTESRVILRRRVSRVTGTVERDCALQMLVEVMRSREELSIPNAPEILTADTRYGTAELVADVLDRGVTPSVQLLSKGEAETVRYSDGRSTSRLRASAERRSGARTRATSSARSMRRRAIR